MNKYKNRGNCVPVDLIEGHWVFQPDGYSVVYHDSDHLPTDGPAKLEIDFVGESGNGPRFTVTAMTGSNLTGWQHRTLDEVVQIAAQLEIDPADVAGRLGREFPAGVTDLE
jgi:hypothetical protein